MIVVLSKLALIVTEGAWWTNCHQVSVLFFASADTGGFRG